MKIRIPSLRWLVFSVLAFVAVVYIAATYLFLIPTMENRIEDRERLELSHQTAELQGTLEMFFRLGDIDGIRREVADASAFPDMRWILVLNDQGKVIAASDLRWLNHMLPGLGLPVDRNLVRSKAAPTASGIHIASASSLLVSYVHLNMGALPTEIRPSKSGTLVIAHDIAPPIGEIRRQATHATTILTVLIVFSTLLIALAAYLLLTRRVECLLQSVRAFSEGNLDARSEIEGGDEIGILSAAFNRMAEDVRNYQAHLEELVQERTKQLEIINKDLEGFAYSVSHDLRIPLRAIEGFSGILLEDYNEKLDDEGKRLIKVVRDNTARMARLIDDILAFTHLGHKEMAAQYVDMAGLIDQTVAELAPSWAERDVKLEVGELPPTRGDAALLRQVWINLLGNAIKFTSPKPNAIITVSGHVEGTETIYSVKDNGVGFDMQYAGKLFGVFQRLHHVDEFEGTGIGLAIVKRIITRHGGRVWAEGKVGDGATFYFALPSKPLVAAEGFEPPTKGL